VAQAIATAAAVAVAARQATAADQAVLVGLAALGFVLSQSFNLYEPNAFFGNSHGPIVGKKVSGCNA
jgi:hypothetical protein